MTRVLLTTVDQGFGLYDYYRENAPPQFRWRFQMPRRISFGLRFLRQNVPEINILEYPTKAEYLASLNDYTSHEEQAVNENMNAHVYGDAALVTGIYAVKGVEKGKPFSRRERFIDTWVHRTDGWICVASQVTLIGH